MWKSPGKSMVNSSYFIIAIANNFDIVQLKKGRCLFSKEGWAVKQINGSYTQRFSYGKYGVQQISAHICDRGGGTVEANSFLPENKKKLFHRFTHRLYVCLFLSDDNASEF